MKHLPIIGKIDNKRYRPQSKGKVASSSWELMLRLMGYFTPYRWNIVWAVLGMLVVAGATGASAFLVQPALDDIFINKDRTALVMVPLLFVLVIAAKGLGRFVQNYVMSACGLRVLEELRTQLYERIMRLPVSFFEERQTGMLMSRIIYDVSEMRASLPSVIMLVRQVLAMVALIGVVFYRDATLAAWAVIVLPLAIYPFIYFGKKLRKLGRKNQGKLSDISAFLQEGFSGVRVVKAFAAEEREALRFRDENERLADIALTQTVYGELSSPVMELIGALGMGLVIWYGGTQVISGHSTPGTFFSFLTGLILLYDPIKKLNKANQTIQRALAGAERVFEILDSPELEAEQGGDAPFPETFEKFEFQNVSFRYGTTASNALTDIELTALAGQRIAFVGPSGAGKTTLVNLIPAFLRPTSGRILLNGRDLADYDLASLRTHIGMVSQEAFLFSGTLRANIAYGRDDASSPQAEEAIRRAADAAFATEFIDRLPEGFDTVIGERGIKLSGGQKQRVTIARALMKDPPLLILDEATSALDTESERKVQLALDNLMIGRTSFVIAHRLSTILTADLIVVLKNGRIDGMGPHAQLLETCETYATLYRMQFEAAENGA